MVSNLHNLFSTQYSCSQELGKKVSNTWKTFLTANLDNYSNKILFLDFSQQLLNFCFIFLSSSIMRAKIKIVFTLAGLRHWPFTVFLNPLDFRRHGPHLLTVLLSIPFKYLPWAITKWALHCCCRSCWPWRPIVRGLDIFQLYINKTTEKNAWKSFIVKLKNHLTIT